MYIDIEENSTPAPEPDPVISDVRSADSAVASAAQAPRTYPAAAAVPTQSGGQGLCYDFNEGCRLLLPLRDSGIWRARIRDLDSGNVLFETETNGGLVRSAKRWFVRFGVEIWSLEAPGGAAKLEFEHRFDLQDREVAVHFPVGTLGDAVAWFSFAAKFAEAHPAARLTCVMAPLLIPLFADAYPNIRFLTAEDFAEGRRNETTYATYYLGLFFNDAANEWQPVDFRHVGLHRTAAHILGLDPQETAPRLALPDETRPIPERYVLIAAQASSAAKMWNNPNGWREVVSYLKGRGYRVICIDQKPVHGQGIFWNHIPYGCEDMTGDRPLSERARWLKHADLFVGLASGLSWLAWATGCKVALISGFSLPDTEFTTPYRVINWHTCNGCWNDVRHTFDHNDFLWCPRHAGTARQFECTRLITPAHVIAIIERALGAAPAELKV
jgi:autotransporter strand-loop-strand O-heptosyltransferase